MNLIKIVEDLHQHSYELEGYKVDLAELLDDQALLEKENMGSTDSVSDNKVSDVGTNFACGGKNETSTEQMVRKNDHLVGTIPEIISNTKIEIEESIVEIISYLNEKASKQFLPTTKETKTLILDRWNEGFRVADFKKVIDIKTEDWLLDGRKNKFLRPSTLFGPKFEAYLNEGSGETAFDLLLEQLEKESSG